VVLNIMDTLRGQYDQGPVPAPQFVWPLERLYVASPVAMDTVGFETLLAKQIEAGRRGVTQRRRMSGKALRPGRGGKTRLGGPQARRSRRERSNWAR
jgi:hypothetical protein